MDKAVLLLSGGIDSTTLLRYLVERMAVSQVHALTFCYGQKHSRETAMARWQAGATGVAEHKHIDMSFFGELASSGSALTDPSVPVPDLRDLGENERRQPATYVPNRNMVLLSIAGGYAESVGIGDVFYGAQAQDEYGYWDCAPEFVERINAVFGLNRRRPVTVHAPFAGMGKAEVVKIGLALGVDYSHTWTCYRGETEPCEGCPSCVERAAAFSKVGAKDPLLNG